MNQGLSIKRMLPNKVFQQRILMILIVGVLVNLIIFYLGAYQSDKKIQEAETDEFFVHSQKINHSSGGTTDYNYYFCNVDKNNAPNKLIHNPLPDGTFGNVTVETVLVHNQGRIIGIDLLYCLGNNTYHKEMTNKFLSTYEESMWWAEVNIPNNSDFCYKFKIVYTSLKPDVYRFYDRCETVINGGILYKDTRYRTETPPLITYSMIPGYFLAKLTNPTIGFSVYFMLFAIICAILAYLFFRRWGDKRAYLMGLMLAVYPSMLDGAFSAQDEPLVAFVFMFPIFLMLLKQKKASALSMGVGVGVKMWSGLLFPGLLSTCFSISAQNKRRLVTLQLITAFAAPILVLFSIYYFLARADFIYFLKGYIGLASFPSGGYTIWSHFFANFGWFSLLKILLICLTIMLILLVFYVSSKQDIHPVRVMMIIMTLFFMFYPKVLNGYYAFLAIVFLPAMAEDFLLFIELYSIPLLLGTKEALSGSVLFSIFLMLSWVLLCDAFRRAAFKPYALDYDLGNSVEKYGYTPLSLKILENRK